PGERFKLETKRPTDRTRTSERLQFPELGARFVIDAEGFERTNQRPVLAIRPQPRIERSEATFRTRLSHSCDQALGRACLFAHKKNIEVGTVSDFAPTAFSERNTRTPLG